MKAVQPSDFFEDHFLVTNDIKVKHWDKIDKCRPYNFCDSPTVKVEPTGAVKVKHGYETISDEGDIYTEIFEETLSTFHPFVDFSPRFIEVTEDLDLRSVPIYAPNTTFIIKKNTEINDYPTIYLGSLGEEGAKVKQVIGAIEFEVVGNPEPGPTYTVDISNEAWVGIGNANKVRITNGGFSEVKIRNLRHVLIENTVKSRFAFGNGSLTLKDCDENVIEYRSGLEMIRSSKNILTASGAGPIKIDNSSRGNLIKYFEVPGVYDPEKNGGLWNSLVNTFLDDFITKEIISRKDYDPVTMGIANHEFDIGSGDYLKFESDATRGFVINLEFLDASGARIRPANTLYNVNYSPDNIIPLSFYRLRTEYFSAADERIHKARVTVTSRDGRGMANSNFFKLSVLTKK